MKILVGYDGTNVAREAIAVAEQHARVFGAEIVLVYSMVGGPEVPREDFETAENSLEHEKSTLRDKKIPCDSILSVQGLQAGEVNAKRMRLLSVFAEDQEWVKFYSAPPLNM
jgi:nucleotide-binding universal stress UspA family protein